LIAGPGLQSADGIASISVTKILDEELVEVQGRYRPAADTARKAGAEKKPAKPAPTWPRIPSPEIKSFSYARGGQEEAKKSALLAVYNHYKRPWPGRAMAMGRIRNRTGTRLHKSNIC